MRKILSAFLFILISASLFASVGYYPSIQISGGVSAAMLTDNLNDGNIYLNSRERLTADLLTITVQKEQHDFAVSLPMTFSVMNSGSVKSNRTIEPRTSVFLSLEFEWTWKDVSEALYAGAGFTKYEHLKSYNLVFQVGERTSWMPFKTFGFIFPLTFEFTKNDWNAEAGMGLAWRL